MNAGFPGENDGIEAIPLLFKVILQPAFSFEPALSFFPDDHKGLFHTDYLPGA
jgi:hypothetical protein